MIILARTLRCKWRGQWHEFQVRLFAPVEQNNSWHCDYEIDWPGGHRLSFAAGIDPVQAFMMAMQKIGIELYASEHHDSGQLIWLEPGAGYGFPVPRTMRDVLIGDDKRFDG